LINDLGIYDGEFLKKHTNAPYLIGPEGYYVRDQQTQKPLLWDEGKAKPYDAPDLRNPALKGSYGVDGVEARPAFEILREHVRKYSPERVSQITTVPAETIRRIAREFGEAARVGSTIIVGGKEFPYRPVAVTWNRGAIAHRHAMLTGLAIQLLNIVVGALDVPGGLLGCNPVGPFWAPQEGPDGFILPSPLHLVTGAAYPARPAGPPKSVEMRELFPVAGSSAVMFEESMLHPEKYQLPYRPEVLIRCSSNVMINTSNPTGMAEALMKIPFMISFALYMDETVEFADMVLPDTHYLERLVPFPNSPISFIAAGQGSWYWMVEQPVVEPPATVRNWMDVVLEIAERVGFLDDLYTILNANLMLKDGYKLDSGKKHTWEEIGSLWSQSRFGSEYDLSWFRERGFLVSSPKKVEEAYPRPFVRPRMPVYLEYLKKAGEDVRQTTEKLGIAWDVADYQPMPDWKPCPSHEENDPDYDLYAVNYKLPFHTFSFTAENPWLNELSEHHPYAYNIMIGSDAAKRKGIKDGEKVWVESVEGYKVQGKARVTECIHPEVIGIAGTFGHWGAGMPIARGKGVHFNSLFSNRIERIDTLSAALDSCARVRVYK
ncbi:MAG: molybdopterin-dependent oxidoreductase, partial [Chloroflexi bacterium]|nr:molybdopterin-dependent oxidoreductase [Chloroflexota bacterium]